jgi:DNA sulfur modification protein DndB
MSESRISPSQGHVIAGVIIDDHTFDGKVKAAQLFQCAADPRRTEDARAYRIDPALQNLRRVRLEMQRLFTGKKRKNVAPYARYILSMYEGGVGITPTIVLWTSTPLMQEERGDGMAQLMAPFEEQLVAIDGATQLAARYVAREINNPGTAREWVAIKICHGRDVSWARQALHDLNVLGVHPSAALAMSMDARDS